VTLPEQWESIQAEQSIMRQLCLCISDRADGQRIGTELDVREPKNRNAFSELPFDRLDFPFRIATGTLPSRPARRQVPSAVDSRSLHPQ
jgi:hypothetical protein